ncbi:hypothetical protein Tco_0462011 [Tanacetum coccineum]
MNQNLSNSNSSSFDQFQPPQYPVIRHSPQETSEEVLQAREDLMKSIQTFLRKFSRIPFEEMPKFPRPHTPWNLPTFYNVDDDNFDEDDFDEAEEEIDNDIFHIEDEILREKLLNVNLLVDKIEALKLTPSIPFVLEYPSSSPIPVVDSEFL